MRWRETGVQVIPLSGTGQTTRTNQHSPCAKRAERGVPCEYTTEPRTSHGPSKGYVHHLEAKLRELQQNAALSRDGPAEKPPSFNAINKPHALQAPWSTSP